MRNVWKLKYETIQQAFVNLAHGNHQAYERRRDLEQQNASYLRLHEEQRQKIGELQRYLHEAHEQIAFLKKLKKTKAKKRATK